MIGRAFSSAGKRRIKKTLARQAAHKLRWVFSMLFFLGSFLGFCVYVCVDGFVFVLGFVFCGVFPLPGHSFP